STPDRILFPYTTLFRSGGDFRLSAVIGEREKKVRRCRSRFHRHVESRIRASETHPGLLAPPGCGNCLVCAPRIAAHELLIPVDRSEEHTSELQSPYDLV